MTDTEKRISELEAELKELKSKQQNEERQGRLVVERTPASVRSFVDGDYYVRDTKLDRVITSSFSNDKELLEKKTEELNNMTHEEIQKAIQECLLPLGVMEALSDILKEVL